MTAARGVTVDRRDNFKPEIEVVVRMKVDDEGIIIIYLRIVHKIHFHWHQLLFFLSFTKRNLRARVSVHVASTPLESSVAVKVISRFKIIQMGALAPSFRRLNAAFPRHPKGSKSNFSPSAKYITART